ncbi:hypothetical protein L8C07_01120 [Paenibacillus sp. CMAA1739]|uniref:hypothetical protein n=1 Tax=Paenibacillus ottowii TaxID=2315729 RepID=UPI0027303F41|nr:MULTISPECIES: hypothetical protein [Paenibacillus]MDP1509343.1 hypothetical protein [Paenibacillus ottowii]MEC4564530.1 hypothetical protein [Paenibacillus sp. CMAA1739]
MQNKNSIRRLVKNNCACYLGAKHGISNYCCLQDGLCTFFSQNDDLPRCTYFEQGVLPTDEKLEREYKSERNVESEFKTAQPRVNCQKCRDKNANEKSKLRMRQMRKSRLDVTL